MYGNLGVAGMRARIIPDIVWRLRRSLLGIGRFPEPASYFGPGGLPEAEAICAEANRDLLGYIRPPKEVGFGRLLRAPERRGRRGVIVQDWVFDSPMPSGSPVNDRVRLRLYRPSNPETPRRVVIFHHPIHQQEWATWGWFLSGLIRHTAVAMMSAPHHLDRAEPGRYPGEATVNPNPARVFEALRQWCWDNRASVEALREQAGLELSAVVGFSFGAFQSLLLGSAGEIPVPIVSIASTNRYAWGLTRSPLARGLLDGMKRVGIDGERLARMTDSVQLERHVRALRGHPVFNIRGRYDRIDPPPSLDRLENALQPARSLNLPANHGGLLLCRGEIVRAMVGFLRDTGALPADDPGRSRLGEPTRTAG